MIMPMEEIHKQYNGEWVFMINCTKKDGMVNSGEVVLHSKSQDEVFRKMGQYEKHPSLTYIRFAGKIPEGVSIIL